MKECPVDPERHRRNSGSRDQEREGGNCVPQNAETACVDSVLLQSCEHTLPFILNRFCLFV